ncbi:hypothetical protein [Hymenobacter properus]|uniref:Uncharacterized protein n=1 Tax=Hymenobacter properus TaxID=2791026 RepID=A0A931BDB7_9BACT|nr:hypothetical protein [Hymenobacter properus]MBF9141259.1 hypothetical protein [Hymenobacter properus]MBR7720069.1 hypothetical protein [Microvirga sp. SRT04]
MKKILLLLGLITQSLLSAAQWNNGPIDSLVLKRYLQKAITMEALCGYPPPSYRLPPSRPYLDTERAQDFADLNSINAMFIGRVAGFWADIWDTAQDNDHFDRTFQNVRKLLGPDSNKGRIAQAAVFEYAGNEPDASGSIDSNIKNIHLPDWVWYAWHPATSTYPNRNFIPTDIGFLAGQGPTGFAGFSVVDVTRDEAKMWLYYRACSYIASDIEALHMGQWNLIAFKDAQGTFDAQGTPLPPYYHTKQLFDKIRSFARFGATNLPSTVHFTQRNSRCGARRQYVILDCHSKRSIKYYKEDLFNFYSFPIRPVNNPTQAGTEGLYGQGLPIYGTELRMESCVDPSNSMGGIPYGDHANTRLWLVEFDNSDGPHPINPMQDCWGQDEISWFGQQPPRYRADWLRYAYTWLRCNEPDIAMQMPGRRSMGSSRVYRFNEPNTPEKSRIHDLWAGYYDMFSPSYAIPSAANPAVPATTRSNIAVELDGSIFWTDPSGTIRYAKSTVTGSIPTWSHYAIPNVSNAAGDLVFHSNGVLFYRTTSNTIDYCQFVGGSGWQHFTTNTSGTAGNVSGNLVFEARGRVNNRVNEWTVFYRSIQGWLEYVKLDSGTSPATWSHDIVTQQDPVDDTDATIACLTSGTVAFVSNHSLKVYRWMNGWTNMPVADEGTVRGELAVDSYYDAADAFTGCKIYYCTTEHSAPPGSPFNSLANHICYRFYDASSSYMDAPSAPINILAYGDINIQDSGTLIFRTPNSIAKARWGCLNGSKAGGWIIEPYSSVNNCHWGLTRQRDGSLFYVGTNNEVRYLTWEAIR